jgi:hypothetical protein
MSLKKYITESQRRSEFAVTGDIFTAEINEELAVEMPVMYHNHELVILEADEFALNVMEHCGCQYIDDEDDVKEDHIDWDKAKKDADDRNIFAKPGPISGYKSKVMGPITKGLTSLATSIGKAVHPNDKTVDQDLAKQQGKFLDKLEKQINNEATPASQQAAMDKAFKNMDQNIDRAKNNPWRGTQKVIGIGPDQAKDGMGKIGSLDSSPRGGSNVYQMKNRSDYDAVKDIETSVADLKFNTDIDEAEYQGREVKLGKPMPGDVKKYKVYVKDPKTGNVKKVNFGDPNMQIRRDNPEARKNFRARHNCADKKDRTKAGYWSCRMWSNKPVSKILKGK